MTIKSHSKAASSNLSIGLIVLLIFAFFRPIATSIHHVGTISTLDIFGIGSSYLMILGILCSIKKVRLDMTLLLMLYFSFYVVLSLWWGSEYRDAVRMILPFLAFVLAAAAIRSEKDIRMVLYSLILGYLIPILGSTFLILIGKSETVIGSNLLERHAGLASGAHSLGHAMLFFSFIYGLYLLMVDRTKKPTEFKIVTILLVLSLFCMFKSYTRTVFLGSVIFWSTYLWQRNKKALILLAAVGSVIGVLYMADAQNLLWQTRGLKKPTYDISTASSGRTWIWEHNLKLLSNQPSTRIIMGVGLGNELDYVPGSFDKWVGSHNDYLSLIITLGVLGLMIYLMIYGAVFNAILKSKIDRQFKYFFLGLMVAVFIMNFVSNSYIVRFQMAQLLWLFVGLFYAMRHMKAS